MCFGSKNNVFAILLYVRKIVYCCCIEKKRESGGSNVSSTASRRIIPYTLPIVKSKARRANEICARPMKKASERDRSRDRKSLNESKREEESRREGRARMG